MEKIALERLGSWIGEAFNTTKDNFSNIAPYGAIALGLIIGNQLFSGCLTGLVTHYLQTPGVSNLVTMVTGMIVQAITTVGLVGVCSAILGGRDAEMSDFTQNLSVWTQALIAIVLQQVILGAAVLVAAIPGGVIMLAAIPMTDKGPALLLGGLLMVVLILPAVLCANALVMFAVPLVVEEGLDFWTAITRSVDCAKRDLAGLILFQILLGLTVGVGTMCTCVIGTIFFTPMAAMGLMIAYRDYFGPAPEERIFGIDPNAPPPINQWDPSPYGGRGFEGLDPLRQSGADDGIPPPPVAPRVPLSVPILPPRDQSGFMPPPMAEPSPMPMPPSVPVAPPAPPPLPPPLPARVPPPSNVIPPPPIFPPPPGFRPPLPQSGMPPPPPRDQGDDDFDPNRLPPPPPPA